MSDKKSEAIKLLNDSLNELESPKGSVTVGVQKLSRAANLLDKTDIHLWAEIQLDNPIYSSPIYQIANKIKEDHEKNGSYNLKDASYEPLLTKFHEMGLKLGIHLTGRMINNKSNPARGGNHGIGYLEANLPKLNKTGRFGGMILHGVLQHIDFIKQTTYQYSAELLKTLQFSGTVDSCFDLLKNAVDDKLLDLDVELAEQLMLAFKGISSTKKEEWSQALTSCRRLLESLADKLYPPNDKVINKRTFKPNQYINRLWQFMSESIESESNRDLAKMHVDYLGSWLEKNYKMTNKGVHSEVSQLEATRVVFHMYLMLSDLLDYLDPSQVSSSIKPSLKTATLDDFEVRLNIKREIAKAIYKLRIENNGLLTFDDLKTIRGIGSKTLQLAQEQFSE